MFPPYLDGWTFKDLGPDGGPYEESAHPKVGLHTTEGGSLAGAEAAFAPYPPHLGYDPSSRTKMQYIRLDRHSLSFKGGQSDDEFIVQIEMVGFAAETHEWSDEHYHNFASDVVVPFTNLGVPMTHLRFYRQDEGIVLASPNSPVRLSDAEFRSYSGWLGHQHVPAPDAHWDPGGFLIDKAFEYAAAEMAPPTPEEMLNMVPGTIFYARSKTDTTVWACQVVFDPGQPAMLKRKATPAEWALVGTDGPGREPLHWFETNKELDTIQTIQ